MASKKNTDFKANPSASSLNMLSIRADVTKLGKTKANYTAQVTAAVTAVNLGGDYDGHKIYLPESSYAVSANGAAALEAALKAQLDGMVDSIEVVYTDTTTDTLDVNVVGSILVFKTLNATSFTASNVVPA